MVYFKTKQLVDGGKVGASEAAGVELGVWESEE